MIYYYTSPNLINLLLFFIDLFIFFFFGGGGDDPIADFKQCLSFLFLEPRFNIKITNHVIMIFDTPVNNIHVERTVSHITLIGPSFN